MVLKQVSFRRVCIIVVCLVVIVGLIIFIRQTKGERFNFLTRKIENEDHVVFYTKKQSCELFQTDPDSYFERLTDMDKYAMNIRSVDEATEKMCNASRSFTPEEQIKIARCCLAADQWFQTVKMPHFDGKKCADIKWKFVLTVGRANEEGMPHTKADVIYLSDSVISDPSDKLTAVLIHEKVHVYERKYPQLMEKWIKWAGYKLHRRQSDIYTARSNPDVDGWTYIDPQGKETVVLYNASLRPSEASRDTERYNSRRYSLNMFSSLPSSILDATYPHNDDPATEHPYEMLAYTLDNKYTQELRSKK